MKPEIKEKILQASEKLFNRFGISKTGLEDIAEQADVAKGTIYNYFGNKDGVIRAVIEEKINRFTHFIETYLHPEQDPLFALKKALIEKIRIRLETPFLSDTMLQRKKNIGKFISSLDTRANQCIDRLIQSKISKKIQGFDPEKVKETLTLYLKGIEETIKQRFDALTLERIEENIDYIIQLLFSGYNPASRYV